MLFLVPIITKVTEIWCELYEIGIEYKSKFQRSLLHLNWKKVEVKATPCQVDSKWKEKKIWEYIKCTVNIGKMKKKVILISKTL